MVSKQYNEIAGMLAHPWIRFQIHKQRAWLEEKNNRLLSYFISIILFLFICEQCELMSYDVAVPRATQPYEYICNVLYICNTTRELIQVPMSIACTHKFRKLCIYFLFIRFGFVYNIIIYILVVCINIMWICMLVYGIYQ